MLVTTCRHCGARFRVTPDQLNLRQGQVRCGQCQEVFNGFEALERFPGDDTGARLLAMRAAARNAPAEAAAGLESADLGRRVTPPHVAEPASAPAESRSPAAAAPPSLADVPDLVVDSEEPAIATPAEVPMPEPAAASAAAVEAAPPAPRKEPQAQPLLLAPPPPKRPSRAWSFGVALLGLVLTLQLVYASRSQLAGRYPPLRPLLESACAHVGCTVPWANDESALKLEDSELLEVPGRPGQIALQARIRNLSASAQEYPHLELTLTDLSGQTAVRRVLRPADYLGRAPAPGEALGGSSEVLVSVRLETARARPTGYELLLFYP
jgi:predicted Zn finger-like uncharacterized protein